MALKLLLLMLCAKFHEVTMDDGALVMFIDTVFTCNDGTLIRGRQVCNRKKECFQNEDENFCPYHQDTETRETFAKLGQNATLYCDASTEDKDDRVSRVSWFRGLGNKEERLLHRFDAEKKPSIIATEWSSPTALKRKAGFKSITQPADLTIYDITKEDEGYYSCHVDFQKSLQKLTLSRLYMAMNPSSVNITTKREYLLAGKSVDIECRSKGSYPRYEITWSLGSQTLQDIEESTPDNGTYVSVLTFQPSATDDGKYLTCRSRNPDNAFFADSLIEDKNGVSMCNVKDIESIQNVELGKEAVMPCDASTQDEDDRVSKVSWFRDTNNKLLHGFDAEKNPSVIATEWSSPTASKQKASFESTTQPANLTIYDITKEDEGVYTCQVDFQKSPMKNSKSRLIIRMKPSFINITTKREYLSAGKSVDVECQSKGSYPSAEITWWFGSKKLPSNETRITAQGEVSVISFKPNVTDDQRYLTCRAQNPHIQDIANSAIEDKWRLNVQYNPIPRLQMANFINPDNIKEGDDVYFECYMRANPRITKFTWFHNGLEIPQSIAKNIIKTDHNLILQRIQKTATGKFTCYAENAVGSGESDPVNLEVKYTPICRKNETEIHRARKQETVLLKCEVDANPPPTEFIWSLNTSSSNDMKSDQEPNLITTQPNPFFNYTPKSDSEFGTLSCKARNTVGVQITACSFQIVAAD